MLTKPYVHYSYNNNIELYDKPGVRHIIKPVGLWITDESERSWLEWCKASEFGCGNHIFDLKLNPIANILQIDTLVKLDDFAREYQFNPFKSGSPLVSALAVPDIMDWIDWGRVIVDYDGILIFPHFYERHLEFIWYNAWDCASGCLFRPTLCVKEIRYRGERQDEQAA